MKSHVVGLSSVLPDARLIEVLRRSQDLGFIGPGEVEDHITHASRFLDALETPAHALDLGSGGGLPGLVLASELTPTNWCLLDVGRRRCEFLRSAVRELDLTNVRILEGRAEDLARSSELRHSFDVVVARSFGQPAVTAECATGFLSGGGRLIVSEPPGSADRWDMSALSTLGMEVVETGEVAVIRQAEPCGERWPRRNGVPTKRPLF